MAIAWGGYATIGGVSVRAGVEHIVSPANPGPSTTSVTVTTRIYLGAGNTGWGNGTWTAGDDATGSGSFSWNLARGGSVLAGTVTTTVPLIYGQAQSWRGRGTVRPFTTQSGTVTAATTITIPARPVSAPVAPSGLTATRSSDTRQNLSWTRNHSEGAPYVTQKVRRRRNGGEWVTIATVAGTATTFSDSSTTAGNVYDYAVQATNSAGDSVHSSWATLSTTPTRPSAPSATKNAAGNIVVSRPALSASATSWTVRQASGEVLATGIPASQSSWTHTNPSTSVAWTYQIQAVSSGPTLSSAWSPSSNTVQLVAPPNAPSHLGPTAGDGAEVNTLTWRHNPVDTTPQSQYQIRHRARGDATWTTPPGVTTRIPQAVIPAQTWENGTSREWQVRTWGEHGDPSPWSSTSVLVLSARPVAGITTPGATHPASRLTVGWTYHDDESSPQSRWEVQLLRGSFLMEERSGFGPSTAVTLTARVEDGSTYTARVRVRDGAGLWSDWATQTFTVSYARPDVPLLAAEWREDDGYAVLSVGIDPNPPAGTRPPAAQVRVERASPEGWVIVADELPVDATATDMIPPTGTVVTYRAVAVTEDGAEAYSAEAVVQTSARWLFINYGPGFGSVVRLRSNVVADQTYSKDRTLRRYAGRPRPVVRDGIARDETYNVTATLWAPHVGDHGQSSWEDLKDAHARGIVACVRDRYGHRLFVTVGAPERTGLGNPSQRVTIPLTVVDHDEAVSQ